MLLYSKNIFVTPLQITQSHITQQYSPNTSNIVITGTDSNEMWKWANKIGRNLWAGQSRPLFSCMSSFGISYGLNLVV